jgi:hypothetical protein
MPSLWAALNHLCGVMRTRLRHQGHPQDVSGNRISICDLPKIGRFLSKDVQRSKIGSIYLNRRQSARGRIVIYIVEATQIRALSRVTFHNVRYRTRTPVLLCRETNKLDQMIC